MSHRRRAFIRRWTRLEAPPLVPEVRLHVADRVMPLWEALARYVLDHPQVVGGRRVVDLATGSGLCAIGALHAGARQVLAVDIDPWARDAVALNASANGVHVPFVADDLLGGGPPDTDVILAGDIGYEWALAERGVAWLRQAAALGLDVLIGDPERHHLPHEGLEPMADYEVPTTLDLEQAASKRTTVYRVTSGS